MLSKNLQLTTQPGSDLSTDGSATPSSSGAAVVLGNGSALRIGVLGRPGERDVSYYGEMVAGIFAPLVVPDGSVCAWVGDNESVLDRAREIQRGWDVDDVPLGRRAGRRLSTWLQVSHRRLAARGSRLVARHQRSHLTVRDPLSRAVDDRMILESADQHAGRARDDFHIEVNISGLHPGVGLQDLYDEHGWRIDGRLGDEIHARQQALRLLAWRSDPEDLDPLQSRFLRRGQ